MKFSKVFSKESIIFELSASRKDDAIRELIAQLVSSKMLSGSLATVVEKAVLRREELGSTGIGKGVAVPHAKVAGIKGVVGALGRSSEGVAFNALDGQPVHVIFLLVSSPDEADGHLRALRKVTTLLKDDDFCAFLKRASSRNDLVDLLREAEERVAV
jgi:PTS system fructose-specific IIA component/PTS system nitrogen regulatory IIA component